MYIYIDTSGEYIYTWIYIYIYRERERERDYIVKQVKHNHYIEHSYIERPGKQILRNHKKEKLEN